MSVVFELLRHCKRLAKIVEFAEDFHQKEGWERKCLYFGIKFGTFKWLCDQRFMQFSTYSVFNLPLGSPSFTFSPSPFLHRSVLTSSLKALNLLWFALKFISATLCTQYIRRVQSAATKPAHTNISTHKLLMQLISHNQHAPFSLYISLGGRVYIPKSYKAMMRMPFSHR